MFDSTVIIVGTFMMLRFHTICITAVLTWIVKKNEAGHNFSLISNRPKSAVSESRDKLVQSKGPTTTLHEPSDHHSKDKTSGCYAFTDLTRTCALYSSI